LVDAGARFTGPALITTNCLASTCINAGDLGTSLPIYRPAEFILKGRRVNQAVPEARTQAEAVRAETKLREDIYHRRYGGVKDVGFTDFFENIYLPWLKDHHPASYRDAVSRGTVLREFFATQKLQEITTKECER
jgi:hypothetical protein